MKRRKRKAAFSIDYIGLGLLALGLGTLQVVLDKGQRDDWFGSHFILVMTVICGRCAGRRDCLGVAAQESDHRSASVPRPLVRRRQLLMFMLGFALLSSTRADSAVSSDADGLSGGAGGPGADAGGMLIIVACRWWDICSATTTRAYLMLFGLCVLSSRSVHMTHFDLSIDFRTVARRASIQALGLAFLFVPINTVAYSYLPREKTTPRRA